MDELSLVLTTIISVTAVVILNCLCCCLIVVVVVVVVSSGDSGYRQEEDSGRPEEDAGGRSRRHFHGVQGTDLCKCWCWCFNMCVHVRVYRCIVSIATIRSMRCFDCRTLYRACPMRPGWLCG